MKLLSWLWENRAKWIGNERGIIGTAAAIITAGVVAGGAAVYASRQQKEAQEAAISSAEQQAVAQREQAAMTPQERAFQSMMMERATAGLEDPQGIDITEAYMPRALEALQKHFMARGFQPSPTQTGL